MTKYYVEAYRDDGSWVGGTLDGQTVLRCRYPMRTAHVKRLIREPRQRLSLDGIVGEYRIVREDGSVYAIVRKDPLTPNPTQP